MADIKLKPCPFCGGNDTWLNYGSMRLPNGVFSYHYVSCRLCGGTMIDDNISHTYKDVIDLWNSRDERNKDYDPYKDYE